MSLHSSRGHPKHSRPLVDAGNTGRERWLSMLTRWQELQGLHCREQVPARHSSPRSGPPTAPPGGLHAPRPSPTSLEGRGSEGEETCKPAVQPRVTLTVLVDDLLDLFIQVLPTSDQGLGPSLPHAVQILLLEPDSRSAGQRWGLHRRRPLLRVTPWILFEYSHSSVTHKSPGFVSIPLKITYGHVLTSDPSVLHSSCFLVFKSGRCRKTCFQHMVQNWLLWKASQDAKLC